MTRKAIKSRPALLEALAAWGDVAIISSGRPTVSAGYISASPTVFCLDCGSFAIQGHHGTHLIDCPLGQPLEVAALTEEFKQQFPAIAGLYTDPDFTRLLDDAHATFFCVEDRIDG